MNTGLLVFGFLAITVPIFFVAVSEMKRIKKTIIICFLVFVGAVNTFMYMEAQFGTRTVELSDLTAEEILEEIPDIAITEEDMTMMQELLESEIIAEAFLLAEKDENGLYMVPWVEDVELPARCIPEGFEVWSASVSTESSISGESVSVSFKSGGETFWMIHYWFDPDFDHLQKTIAVYGKDIFGDQCVTTYDNLNGEITKWEDKRVWFDWVRKYSVPAKVNLSPNFRIDAVERFDVEGERIENITSQLSDSALEEIRQLLLTASYGRRRYPLTSISLCENTVMITAWDEGLSPGDRIHFCLAGGEERYEIHLPSGNTVRRIRNGEEILNSILDIISE